MAMHARRLGVLLAALLLPAFAGQEENLEEKSREAATRAAALCKTIASEDDPAAVAKAFADALVLHDLVDITPETRDSIKADLLSALKVGRERKIASIVARARETENWGRLRELKADLNRRRESALRTLSDSRVYLPESHADYAKGDKANGQAAVEPLILSVTELWRSTSVVAVPDPALKKDLDALLEAAPRYVAALGEKLGDGDLKSAEDVVHNLGEEKLDLHSFSLDAREAELLAWNRRVEAYNRGLNDPGAGAPEKEHAKVINDYREMMGRRRLFLDARLCRAANKHSAACNAAQKIWHAGADGDPQARARAEGFPAPVSENVAIAFPHPADLWWKGWFRASDHHRNALSETWTALGYGYVGNVGTQNFANIPPPKSFPPK